MSGERLPLEIRTERLRLRPWRMDDVEDVLAYATDPEWARYSPSVPQPYERMHAEASLTASIAADRAVIPIWAIEFEGHAIGGTNLRIEPDHARAEIEYSIARAHWGKGFVTEVCRAVIDIAFRTLPLNRVQARALTENLASQRVMEKAGMTYEGRLRHFLLHRGEPADVAMYSILCEDWEAGRAE